MGKTYVQGELLTALDLNNSLSELVNTTGTYVFTGSHTYNANLTLNNNTTSNGIFSINGNAYFYSNVLVSGVSTIVSNTYFYANNFFVGNTTFTSNIVIGTNALLTSANNIIDKIGELRTVVLTPTTGSVAGKTLELIDHGKLVVTTGGITIPANLFTAGQNVSMHNFTDGNITITAGAGLTLYKSGIGSAATATLAKRGIATVIFITGAIAVITGAGLS
jgi:hypothetical protein